MEHRWGRRVSLQVPVRLGMGTRPIGEGRIENVSLSGALVRTPAQIPLWARVDVALSRAHDTSICAQVVREAPNGIALEWCEYAPPVIGELLSRATQLAVAEEIQC
jgi:hypothetical protein